MVMAQLIKTICDACQDNDVETVGEPVEVTMDGKARIIDLCLDHQAEIVAPLREALAALGRPLNAPGIVNPKPDLNRPRGFGRATGDDPITFTCPVEDCLWQSRSRNDSQANRHVRLVHNTEVWAIQRFGPKAAIAGAGMQFLCVIGECKDKPQRFGRPQGLHQHFTQTHQMTLEEAREAKEKARIPEDQLWRPDDDSK